MAEAHTITAPTASEALSWHPLRILCGYRVLLAAVLLGGFLLVRDSGLFSPSQPRLFLLIAAGYAVFAALTFAVAGRARRGFLYQVVTQGIVDVIAIGGLIHASGGLQAGRGVLMLVPVAGSSLLAGVRFGTLFAALATLILLGDQFLLDLTAQPGGGRYTEAALLGIATFITALAGAFLAHPARENEALAHRRGIDIADLEALNAHIVQRVETGVIAIDTDGRLRLANQAARGLLGGADPEARPTVGEAAPDLAAAYHHWQESWESGDEPISDQSGRVEYVPRFQPIGMHGENGTLVFLDNVTQMRAQVQQAKLVSLGRLTASIAHEVRNPLGAMLQAGQLLGEADYLRSGERRLVEIIGKQGRRINKTVENVHQLSRRAPAERRQVQLDDWLAQFADEWREQHATTRNSPAVETELEHLSVLADPDHLRQIVDNLVRNAAAHASRDRPVIRLRCAAADADHAVLEVADNGGGIDPAIREHLFEPFATGSRTGTGLGLYLARELCEANQARIRAGDEPGGGAVFSIIFMRPGR